MGTEEARERFANVPFADALGVTIRDITLDRAVLVLPFRSEHLNAGGVLQGGASASLVVMAGAVAAWTGVDFARQGRLQCVDLSVQYLARASKGDVVAEATVLRRGRDVIVAETTLRVDAGAPICHGTLTYQAAEDIAHSPRVRSEHVLLPTPMPLIAPAEHRLFRGYVQKLGIAPVHQGPGRARVRMPCTPMHVDERGHVHPGALASIVDIAAVNATWSLVPRREGTRGGTIGMQVTYPTATAEAVVADAHVQQRSEDLFFSTVHVTTERSGQLVAMGQVSYRLVEP